MLLRLKLLISFNKIKKKLSLNNGILDKSMCIINFIGWARSIYNHNLQNTKMPTETDCKNKCYQTTAKTVINGLY